MLQNFIAGAIGATLLTATQAAVPQSNQNALNWYALVPQDTWTILTKETPSVEDPTTVYSEWQLRVSDTATIAAEAASPTEIAQAIATPEPKLTVVEQTPQPTASATPSAAPSTSPSTEATETGLPYEARYKDAGAKYGVPWQILYGLHKTESGARGSGQIMNKSGSGATGPMQFMPGTWRAYGVDCTGDGVADITNVDDAICGAANYLQKHGTLANGLRSYGGNYSGTVRYARELGFTDQI